MDHQGNVTPPFPGERPTGQLQQISVQVPGGKEGAMTSYPTPLLQGVRRRKWRKAGVRVGGNAEGKERGRADVGDRKEAGQPCSLEWQEKLHLRSQLLLLTQEPLCVISILFWEARRGM